MEYPRYLLKGCRPADRLNGVAAVLESEAFGPYTPPDYTQALQQVDNTNPLPKGEVLHHECAPLPGVLLLPGARPIIGACPVPPVHLARLFSIAENQ